MKIKEMRKRREKGRRRIAVTSRMTKRAGRVKYEAAKGSFVVV